MKKKRQNIPIYISVISIMAFCLFVIIYSYHINSKVYTIDDNSYLLSLMNESMPNSLYIEDPVWGMTYISDLDLILDFYDYITSLPLAEGEQNVAQNQEKGKIKGAIYFTSGQHISFLLGEYAVLDGMAYGSSLSRAELNTYINRLKAALYNQENLANLINAQSKVQLRIGNEKKTLAMDQKGKVKELILDSIPMQEKEDLWTQVQSKGDAVCQMEFYVGEQSISPEVYAVIYESGLCMVFDSYGNQSGSIMQMNISSADLQKIFVGD